MRHAIISFFLSSLTLHFQGFPYKGDSIIQMTSECNDLEFDRFKRALDKAIQRHAPIKKRYVRANQAFHKYKDKQRNHEEITSQK